MSEYRVINKDEVDAWLFEHAAVQGHTCNGIQNHHGVNAYYVDTTTGEKIEVLYKEIEDDSD